MPFVVTRSLYGSLVLLIIAVIACVVLVIMWALQPDKTYKLSNDILPNYFMVYMRDGQSWRQIGAFPDKDQALKYIHEQAERQINVQYFTVRGDEVN